jgi:hypothetical protein
VDRVDVLVGGEEVLVEEERGGSGDRVVVGQVAVAEGEAAERGSASGREQDVSVREKVEGVDVLVGAEVVFAEEERGDATDGVVAGDVAVADGEPADRRAVAGGDVDLRGPRGRGKRRARDEQAEPENRPARAIPSLIDGLEAQGRISTSAPTSRRSARKSRSASLTATQP